MDTINLSHYLYDEDEHIQSLQFNSRDKATAGSRGVPHCDGRFIHGQHKSRSADEKNDYRRWQQSTQEKILVCLWAVRLMLYLNVVDDNSDDNLPVTDTSQSMGMWQAESNK